MEKEQLPGQGQDWRPPSPTPSTRSRIWSRGRASPNLTQQNIFTSLSNTVSPVPHRPAAIDDQHRPTHTANMPGEAEPRATANEENLLIDLGSDPGTTTPAPLNRVEAYIRDVSTTEQDPEDLYFGTPTEDDGADNTDEDFPLPPVEDDTVEWVQKLVESRSPSPSPTVTRIAFAQQSEQGSLLEVHRIRSPVTTPLVGDLLRTTRVQAGTAMGTEPLDLLTGPEPSAADPKPDVLAGPDTFESKAKSESAVPKEPVDFMFPDIPDDWGMSKEPKPELKKPATNLTTPKPEPPKSTSGDEAFPPLGQARGQQIPQRSYASAAVSGTPGAPTTGWPSLTGSFAPRGKFVTATGPSQAFNAGLPTTGRPGQTGPFVPGGNPIVQPTPNLRRVTSAPRSLTTSNTRATSVISVHSSRENLRGFQQRGQNTRATSAISVHSSRENLRGFQQHGQNTRGRGYSKPRGGRGSFRGNHTAAPPRRQVNTQFRPPRQANFIPGGPRRNVARVSAQQYRGRVVDGPRPKITPDLVINRDNTATSAWRNKEKQEVFIYTLPLSFNMIAGTSNNAKDSQPAIPRLAEIAAIEGVHIEPKWPSKQERQRTGGISVYIHGNIDAIDRARYLIDQWYTQIKELQKAAKSQWAKVWAFDAAVEKRIQRRIEREEKRQDFRRIPDPDPEGESTYRRPFGWPSDIDYSPMQCLGTNLEALDPIRMEFEVYINYASAAVAPVLLVQGESMSLIEQAVVRLGGVGAQLDARSFEPDTEFFLNIPYFSDTEAVKFPWVNMHDYWNPALIAGGESPEDSRGMVPTLTKPMPRPLAGKVDEEAVDEPLVKRLMHTVSETCQYLPAYRGSMRMRITLGTLVLQNYRRFPIEDNPGYPLNDFYDMMGSHQVEGHVTRELGDKILEEQVLQRCFKAKGLLFPQIAGISSLADIQPVYTASFVIDNPNGKGDLFMDATLSDYEGVSTVENRRWWRLENNCDEMTQLLDANLVNVSHGTAWHFGLESGNPVDEAALSLDYRVFGHSLKLDLDAAKDMTKSEFVIYQDDGVLQIPVKEVLQRRCWRFNTKAGEWVLEVARVNKTVLRPGEEPLHWEPRWTVNFWHNDWDQHLMQNARLEIGMKARWATGNPVNTLFPASGETSNFAENIGITKTEHAYREAEEPEERERRQDYDRQKAIVEGEIDLYANVKPTEPANIQGIEQLLELLGEVHEMIVGEKK
ncbi:hypothetical protein K490DRAFT_59583 [Saccharata proteae CBS 121410]|uniref:DUF7905 domain-containing protein n=1 Tax=Saccharata proteae CBS 121410 TaxID=1314787 RepID=A0A9P4LSE2_9PEZI|nr:hypothetical protein K490DRAFT_59583 [Saccharata proteae CBS 121410]